MKPMVLLLFFLLSNLKEMETFDVNEHPKVKKALDDGAKLVSVSSPAIQIYNKQCYAVVTVELNTEPTLKEQAIGFLERAIEGVEDTKEILLEEARAKLQDAGVIEKLETLTMAYIKEQIDTKGMEGILNNYFEKREVGPIGPLKVEDDSEEVETDEGTEEVTEDKVVSDKAKPKGPQLLSRRKKKEARKKRAKKNKEEQAAALKAYREKQAADKEK